MKKSVYRGAYNVVSWLSDRTGGASFLVRWKLALGVVILGLSTSSLVGCEPPMETCYVSPPEEAMTCYDPVVPPGNEEENGNGEEEGTGGNEEGTGQETGGEDDGVLCYAPVAPPEEEQPAR
jgi:hypothetical protein